MGAEHAEADREASAPMSIKVSRVILFFFMAISFTAGRFGARPDNP
jgi:hypothetical protein